MRFVGLRVVLLAFLGPIAAPQVSEPPTTALWNDFAASATAWVAIRNSRPGPGTVNAAEFAAWREVRAKMRRAEAAINAEYR